MTKREYSGWTYQVDNNNQYDIIPDVEIEKPKTFFKYYALNEYSVSALTEMYHIDLRRCYEHRKLTGSGKSTELCQATFF